MKILLYGENWEGTHVNSISKVLKDNNINHQIFDFYNYIHRNFHNLVLNKIIREINYTKNEKLINNLFLKKFNEYKPSIVLISKGINIYPDTILEIKKVGAKVVNWNPDDFFNHLNTSDNLLNSISLFDTVFSARKHLFDEYKERGIINPIYLEWYYIPWLHKKMENINYNKISKIVTFVGTYSDRRSEIINSIDSKINIEIWGSGWKLSKLRLKNNIKINNVLDQSQFPFVMSKSAVNLNILTKENRDETNLKIFEIPASNGLLVSERTNAINNIFTNGQDCILFDADNSNHLNDLLFGILSMSNDEYINMRQCGYNKIVSNKNSISDRVNFLIDQL